MPQLLPQYQVPKTPLFFFFFILGPIRQACNEGECDKKTTPLQQRHAKRGSNDSREHQKVTEPHGLVSHGPTLLDGADLS